MKVPTRVGTVLGESAIHGDTVCLEMLTEQLLATTAVEALSTKLRVVGDDTIPDLEALDLGTDGSNDTDGFMALKG